MRFHNSGSRSVRLTVVGAALALACLSLVAQTRNAGQTAKPPAAGAGGRPIKVLFLGQDEERPHNPARMFPLLAAPLARRGIQLTYVSTPADALAAARLGYYDAIMLFGNHETITPQQEKALVDYVEGGRGLIALHSASAEFPGSDKYVSLVGGQFQRHGTGEFTAEIVQPSHPITQGMKPFMTWDETYVHTRHNAVDRTVLMERVDAQGREPWTWVRTQGKGRVFYTAYGHDERTWSKPEFQTLVERAVAWAVDDAARRSWQQMEIPPVTYVDGFNVPNYEQRDPAPKYQLPFTPPDAAKFIQAPGEFEVKLFASEPDIIKPITMAFDERGRLWVIEAMDYPNEVLNGNPGDDRIKILEDTNGDGRADKFTIFAENLNVPSSLTFANGGVIVAAQPHFLFLKDTNGDDKADSRQVMNTGWGIRDTHAGPSNLQYAPDNHVWGVVGYSGFDGLMNGKPMQFTQGPYRFKPDGSEFEYLTMSTNNTWGLGFSETFDVFGSTANNDQSWYLAIPNRYFANIEGLPGGGRGAGGPGYQSAAAFYGVHPTTPYIRQVDVFGGYTAAAGHYLYTGRAFPKEYWNRIAFITEPTAHLVGQAVIEKDGAGFVTRDGWNLLSGAEEWFAPIAAMTGPDGAVWVTDWYNFIQQHNPTPVGFSVGRGAAYETSMRDKLRGRIYRVVYKGAPAAKKRSLSKGDTAGLLEALGSDNMLWRLHAQRLIVERGQKDIVPQLIAMVRNKTVDEIGTNGGALHALWTLHGLGELNAPASATADSATTPAYRAAVEALKHPAAGVRKAAVMVLPTTQFDQPILAAGLLQDPDLHTRLAAVLAVADLPTSPEIGQALYTASQRPENYGDRWLSRAIYIAANRHQKVFTAAYRADPNKLPYTGLPISLRLGTMRPDWRAPADAELSSDWKDMQVPGNWESRGLPDFDGVVWFTRTLDWTETAAPSGLSIGPVRNSGEVWVNGQQLTPAPFAPPAAAPGGGRGTGPGAAAQPPAGGRGPASSTFAVPPGALRAGKNTITVRIQNARNDGGFIGQPDTMFIQAGENRTPLAGTWKYRVERQTNAGAFYTRPGQLAAHVAFTGEGGLAGAAGAALPPIAPPVPDVVLRLSVIPNQLKFDLSELTVAAGQLVEVIFSNPDVMQHNFVLGASGSLTQIGQAADKLATSPAGLTQQYVPDIPQVMFSTRLLEPGQSVTFQFRAPTAAGQYPYVCTFPAHWQVMNGILNVVTPAGGRGGRGRGN